MPGADLSSSREKPFDASQAWFVVGRWQELSGEWRANFLRVAAIGTFYLVELADYYGLKVGWLHLEQTVTRDQHLRITGIAVAWVLAALAAQLALARQLFPPALKYLTTGADLVCLTTILLLTHGPASPLVAAYFLVILLAGLRFSLRLVWLATLGSLGGYLFLLGWVRWQVVDPARHAAMLAPRRNQLIIMLAIAIAGVLVGQMVRQARAMAEDYRRRSALAPPADALAKVEDSPT